MGDDRMDLRLDRDGDRLLNHDVVLAQFRARVAMHVRRGWQVIHLYDHPTEHSQALLTLTSSIPPRALGQGVATGADGPSRRWYRQIQVERSGQIRVRPVGGPPGLERSPGVANHRACHQHDPSVACSRPCRAARDAHRATSG